MNQASEELAALISKDYPKDGFFDSPIPGVQFIRVSQDRISKARWTASVSLVVQGEKEIKLGSELYRFPSSHYIATPIDLPVQSRIAHASSARPFLCIKIAFDSLSLSEIASQIEAKSLEAEPDSFRAVFGNPANDGMREAVLRLARLSRKAPQEIKILGPLALREFFFYLLQGPDAAAIRHFVRAGTKTHKISEAVYKMLSNTRGELNVESWAASAHMGRSAFFKHFKEVTSMSPIQYQKRLRLLEAKRMLQNLGETAEGAAFRVGYNSPSQFSREYLRMFGVSPSRDTASLKKRRPQLQAN